MTARYLLGRPRRVSMVPGNDSAWAVVLQETSVPTTRGSERVKLVAIHRGNESIPQFIWLDSHDDLFATEIGWFQTVKPACAATGSAGGAQSVAEGVGGSCAAAS